MFRRAQAAIQRSEFVDWVTDLPSVDCGIVDVNAGAALPPRCLRSGFDVLQVELLAARAIFIMLQR